MTARDPKRTPPRVFVVLPAYNEGDNLRPLLNGLEKVCEHLSALGHERHYVIVDDGSEDDTPHILGELAARLPVTVITHRPNQGLGFTIRDGLKTASELAEAQDIVISMDADNSHPAGLMTDMTARLLEGYDVVIASRYRPGSKIRGLAWHRKVMSIGVRLLFQILFPIKGVRDYTCGYRAYRAAILQKAFRTYGDRFVEHRDFQAMADILLKLAALDASMSEVPMILRYDLKKGTSKMRVGRTVVNTLLLMLHRRFGKRL